VNSLAIIISMIYAVLFTFFVNKLIRIFMNIEFLVQHVDTSIQFVDVYVLIFFLIFNYCLKINPLKMFFSTC